MANDPTEATSKALHVPGMEDDVEPEFQVAPMVDVLLVLLLFFMATATTEVLVQTAELDLPSATDSKPADEGKPGQLVINIEKLNFKLKVQDGYYEKAEELTPLIKQAAESHAQLTGTPIDDFRILVRADSKTAFSRIAEVMKASAAAGVVNVTFAVAEQKEGGAPAPQP